MESERLDNETREELMQARTAMEFYMSEVRIRPDIKESLDSWGNGSRPMVGGFLMAVLENNLKEAFGRADSYNIQTLGAIVSYCYNHLPAECWGSPAKVLEWQKDCVEKFRERELR